MTWSCPHIEAHKYDIGIFPFPKERAKEKAGLKMVMLVLFLVKEDFVKAFVDLNF